MLLKYFLLLSCFGIFLQTPCKAVETEGLPAVSPEEFEAIRNEIIAPDRVDEGTQTQLQPDVLKLLEPWANLSNDLLIETLKSVEQVSPVEAIKILLERIKSIVEKSGGKSNELLMR